jgi:hypothetical protein
MYWESDPSGRGAVHIVRQTATESHQSYRGTDVVRGLQVVTLRLNRHSLTTLACTLDIAQHAFQVQPYRRRNVL